MQSGTFTFAIIAIIMAALGFGGIGGSYTPVAQLFLVIVLAFGLVSFLRHRKTK
jgi:uncharacterized membrane protein YtjA (UPF0391 family)